jgi:hypothetical protein
MPSSNLKRAEQQRTRRKRAQPTQLGSGLFWHPSLVVGEPVAEGRLAVVKHVKRKRDDVPEVEQHTPSDVLLVAEEQPPPPRFPWKVSPRRPRGCVLHEGRCNRYWCSITAALYSHRALALKPFSEERRKAFEAAHEKAMKRIAREDARREAECPYGFPLDELPSWVGTTNNPWADEKFPRYEPPFHILLRPEPRPGHVWVSEPEEIEVEYTDGGPPKLREWQLPESDIDASYMVLPWRIHREVLETSGAHEAQRRGEYVAAEPIPVENSVQYDSESSDEFDILNPSHWDKHRRRMART